MTAVLDANCLLGPTPTDHAPSLSTPATLLAEMDRLGIAESLVHSTHALFDHPADGNQRLLADIAAHRDRLHPAWVLLPPVCGDANTSARLVEQMQSAGVRAAFLYPRQQGYLLLPHLLGDLPAALEAAGLPLFIHVGSHHKEDKTADTLQPAEWAGLAALCAAHPRLPVILCGCDGSDRTLWMLWSQTPNLSIELSGLRSPYGLRVLESAEGETIRQFALSRLVLGTGLPYYDPGGALGLVRWGLRREAHRAAIAGDNLRRLLGLPLTYTAEPTTSVTEEADREANPLSSVFDVQGYCGLSDRAYIDIDSPENLVRVMDRFGIACMAIADFQALGADYQAGNSRAAAAACRFSERLLAYAVYNPNCEPQMEAEIRRCLETERMAGLVLHGPRHEVDTQDSRNILAFQMADQHGVPLLVHPRGPLEPAFFSRLLTTYPRLTLILTVRDSATRSTLHPLLDIARRHRNLVFNLSIAGSRQEWTCWLAGQVGAGQIVFGSGFPLHHIAYQLGRVQFSGLGERDRQRILYENAARIFRVPAAAGAAK